MRNLIRKVMLPLLLAAAVVGGMAPSALAQTSILPDCQAGGRFTATGRQGGPVGNSTTMARGFDNRIPACTRWVLSLTVSGFSASTVALQDAPDSSGAAGTWVNWAGTIVTGTNPSTTTTSAYIVATGSYPWVGVNASTLTGSGTVYWTLSGWKDPNAGSAGTTSVDITGNTAGIATLANQDTQITAEQAIKTNTDTMVGTGVKALDINGNALQPVTDPCNGQAKTIVPFSISSATTTQLLASSSSNKWYICHLTIVVAAANNVALVEDDTAACASPTAGMDGGTTAATGYNLTGNGLNKGNGNATVAVTAAVTRYVCLITSGGAQTSGSIGAVAAP